MVLYAVAGAAVVALAQWWRGRLATPARSVLLATVGGVALLVAVGLALALPYVAVLHDHPEARRTLTDVRALSPPPIGLLSAPEHDAVWGGATAGVRDTLDWPAEQSLWPGLVILVLAVLGARFDGVGIGVRRTAVVGVGVSLVFAFGLRLFGDWSPYRLLYEFAPGWNGVRTPGRIFTLTTLALALLAAAGAARLSRGMRSRRTARTLPVVLVAAIVAEGFGSLPHLQPRAPVARNVPQPRLYLPSADEVDSVYMWWSTDGFPKIVNGISGFRPRLLDGTRAITASFPDRNSVDLLRVLGVRAVVLTPFATRQARAAIVRRPAAHLPVKLHRDGATTWYELVPGG